MLSYKIACAKKGIKLTWLLEEISFEDALHTAAKMFLKDEEIEYIPIGVFKGNVEITRFVITREDNYIFFERCFCATCLNLIFQEILEDVKKQTPALQNNRKPIQPINSPVVFENYS